MPDILATADRTAPGTHALVIGVSHYPFASGPAATPDGSSFDLVDLSSAARSASEFAAWLLEEYLHPGAPLASLRVLLSPADGERIHPSIANRLSDDHAATSAAVRADLAAFRADCSRSPDDVAVVYIAGHGVQVSKLGAIVLLEDFGAPGQLNLLDGAIDVLGCHDGLDAEGCAGQQFWFVDACRQRPAVAKRFEDLSGGPITLDRRTGAVPSTPLFLAASTREAAFAEIGATTLFSQALLWALRGAAAMGPDDLCDRWHVKTSSLLDRLRPKVDELAGRFDVVQTVDVAGRPNPGVAQQFAAPPDVDVSVELAPADAVAETTAELLLGGRTPVPTTPGWPLVTRIPAGLYSLALTTSDRWIGFHHPLRVEPPCCNDRVSVAP